MAEGTALPGGCCQRDGEGGGAGTSEVLCGPWLEGLYCQMCSDMKHCWAPCGDISASAQALVQSYFVHADEHLMEDICCFSKAGSPLATVVTSLASLSLFIWGPHYLSL